MERHSSGQWQDNLGSSAAESLRKDFDALITIFDRQLFKVPEGTPAVRTHIREARKAAARGRRLSEELSLLLRKLT